MKKAYLALASALTVLLFPFAAFAAEGDMTFTATELGTVISTVTGIVNVTTIISFITAILAVGLVFVLMWFGVRKALSSVMGASKKGKVRV